MIMLRNFGEIIAFHSRNLDIMITIAQSLNETTGRVLCSAFNPNRNAVGCYINIRWLKQETIVVAFVKTISFTSF